MNTSYVICNEKNEALNIDGVQIFGKNVCVVAIFHREEDALEVLYAAENFGLKNNRILKMNGVLQIKVSRVNVLSAIRSWIKRGVA